MQLSIKAFIIAAMMQSTKPHGVSNTEPVPAGVGPGSTTSNQAQFLTNEDVNRDGLSVNPILNTDPVLTYFCSEPLQRSCCRFGIGYIEIESDVDLKPCLQLCINLGGSIDGKPVIACEHNSPTSRCFAVTSEPNVWVLDSSTSSRCYISRGYSNCLDPEEPEEPEEPEPDALPIGPYQVKSIVDSEGNLIAHIGSPTLDPFKGYFTFQRHVSRDSEPAVKVYGMKNAGEAPDSCSDGALIEEVSPTVDSCADRMGWVEEVGGELEKDATCSVFTLVLDSASDNYSVIRTTKAGSNSEVLDLCFRVGYCFDDTCADIDQYIAFYDFRVKVTDKYKETSFGLESSISVTSPGMGDYEQSKSSSFTGEASLCDPASKESVNGVSFAPGQGKCNDIYDV